MKKSKFLDTNFSETSQMQEFKHYSADLPIGPLEEDNSDNDNHLESVTSSENLPSPTNNVVPSDDNIQPPDDNIQPLHAICKCTEPVNLDPILIPIKEKPPTEAMPHQSDIVHTKYCSEHVQNARIERNDALRLAKFYRDRVEDLVKEKRDLRHSLESQVDRVRKFWRNQIIEGESRAGRMVRTSLFRNIVTPEPST